MEKEKFRYSDEELEYFRGLINEKIKETRSTYESHQEMMSNKNSNGTDDTYRPFKALGEDTEFFSREELIKESNRLLLFIKKLDQALIRIGNKTYGICHQTGNLIPKDRLISVPHTTCCIEVKEKDLKGIYAPNRKKPEVVVY